MSIRFMIVVNTECYISSKYRSLNIYVVLIVGIHLL